MDTERSRRHASKILTYPITIGSVLHQYSNLTLSNQRFVFLVLLDRYLVSCPEVAAAGAGLQL